MKSDLKLGMKKCDQVKQNNVPLYIYLVTILHLVKVHLVKVLLTMLTLHKFQLTGERLLDNTNVDSEARLNEN